MDCPCELPTAGEKIYRCPRLRTRMTPAWCRLYETRENYRLAWDKGWTPEQPEEPLTREQRLSLAAKQAAVWEFLRPIAERLAEETGELRIVPDALRYRQALTRWKKAGFPVRDEAMRKAITEKMCPDCCRYRDGMCDQRCGGKGQLIAVLAWMATARCPGGVWKLW